MEILENDTSLIKHFIRLNEQWITTYFEIEEADRELAANPYQIIDSGGYIFSAVSRDEVLGVCALFNEGNGVFELARMAVQPKYQGNGFGDKLISVCLGKLSAIGASKVYLVSNTKLESAISLYKKHGFKVVSTGRHAIYSRGNIVMEWNTP